MSIVRVASVRAKQGQATALIEAARANADAARRAPGCRSAEVCGTPENAGRILVISRWASESSLQDFLDWHEQLAHHSLAAFCEGKPHWVHYPVITPTPHDLAEDVCSTGGAR